MAQLSASQFERVERLFHEAGRLPAADRGDFLDAAFNEDADDRVRHEVEALLRHATNSGSGTDALGAAAAAVPAMLRQAVASGVATATATRSRSALLRELIGTRIGAYEFTDVIGQGGMGVVYLARDVRLGRPVAIKAVPPAYAGDPLRLSRFLREAKILASLSHPNIATVFGLEESAGAKFLVMEHVEGESLAKRLSRGPLPMDEALGVASAVAGGVSAAHAAGVVHRDLKPANVMFTADGKVKVLDFGLAREVPTSSSSPMTSRTMLLDGTEDEPADDNLTREGAVLGTPGYMSPEQVRGRVVDQRTDVFSLGCILYECLTGRVAFPGGTCADVIAHVLEREPDWSALPARTPPAVRRLLLRCVAKDAGERMHNMADVRLELDEALAAREWVNLPATPAADGPSTLNGVSLAGAAMIGALPRGALFGRIFAAAVPWLLAGLAGVAALSLWLRTPRSAAPVQPATLRRFAVPFPNGAAQSDLSHIRLGLSRNGDNLVVSASDGREQHLFVRNRAEPDFRKLDGTLDGWIPSFSPDGDWVVYFDSGVMRKRRLSGGGAAKVTDVPGYWGSYHWGADGQITYVASWSKGIARVSDRGGDPAFFTTPKYDKGEFAHLSPVVLPDGSAMLYAVWDGKTDTRIDAVDLATRKTHTVVDKGSTPRVANTPAGVCLLWERAGTIYAAPFDAKTVKLSGRESAVADGVLTDRVLFHACYDVADDGTLAFVPGPSFAEESRLAWLDLKKDEPSVDLLPEPFSVERLSFVDPHFSADQKRLSVLVKGDVYRPYVYDLERGTFDRVVMDGDCASAAVSPDGQKLVYSTNRNGPYELWVKWLDGSRDELILAPRADYPCAVTWSPDGRHVAYSLTPDGTASRDVWVVNVEDKKAVKVCAHPEADERGARFSPDGKWLAYVSNESGKREVYIRSFPNGSQTRQVSREGGDWPEWTPDGRKLYFRGKGGLYVTTVARDDAATSESARATIVYPRRFGQSDVDLPDYTVAPDGRLLIIEPSEDGPKATTIQYVLNWYTLLKSKPAAVK